MRGLVKNSSRLWEKAYKLRENNDHLRLENVVVLALRAKFSDVSSKTGPIVDFQ